MPKVGSAGAARLATRGVGPVFVLVVFGWAAAIGITARAQDKSAGPAALSFNRDIRPILSNNCFACHGPDEKQRETTFHFDTREAAFSEEGIIVPGDAAKSVLYQRITNKNPEKRMPPPDSGHA